MLSYSERNRRRGAMTERDFLAAVRRLGFVGIPPAPEAMWQFTHAETGGHVYTVPLRLPPGGYVAALAGLSKELSDARRISEICRR